MRSAYDKAWANSYSQGLPDTHIVVARSKCSFWRYNVLTKMIVPFTLVSPSLLPPLLFPCGQSLLTSHDEPSIWGFLSFNFYVGICEFLTLLALCSCAWAFSCGKQGLLSNCSVWASHCGDLSHCRAWTPGRVGSWVVAHRLLPHGVWHLLGPAIEPMSLHQQAGSLPLGHQGSPMCCFLSWKSCCLQSA